jgi:hypothetical protein
VNDMSAKPAEGLSPSFPSEHRAAVPAAFQVLLGAPPVVHGESAEDYTLSLLSLAEALAPRDAADWLILKDIADANWEAQRMQRYIAAIVREGVPRAARCTLGQALARVSDEDQIAGETTAPERDVELKATMARLNIGNGPRDFRKKLKRFNVTETDVAAQSYASQIEIIAQLESNMARCDDKKTRLLRDYERRQTVCGRTLRHGRQDITDLPDSSVT